MAKQIDRNGNRLRIGDRVKVYYPCGTFGWKDVIVGFESMPSYDITAIGVKVKERKNSSIHPNLIERIELPEPRVFFAALRVMDKQGRYIPQCYINAAYEMGMITQEVDCDGVYPSPTQKFLDLQEKYFGPFIRQED